jgi:predicted RNase H-like nuclease (RuvC/YqgF family)
MQKSIRSTTSSHEFESDRKLLTELRTQIGSQSKDLEVRAKIIKDLQRDFEKLTTLLIEERGRVTELNRELAALRRRPIKQRNTEQLQGVTVLDKESIDQSEESCVVEPKVCPHIEVIADLMTENQRLQGIITERVRPT